MNTKSDDQAKISVPRQKKIETVNIIKEKIQKAGAFFLADYQGLTHHQLEELRKDLKKTGAEFTVTKNTLMKLAIKQAKIDKSEKLENELKNPMAALFAYENVLEAVKSLSSFIKKYQLPKVKIGFFDGKIASHKDFDTLSTLFSRETLLAILISRMKNPFYGLHYALSWNMQRLVTALNNVKAKK